MLIKKVLITRKHSVTMCSNMLTRFIWVIILQYIQTSNHYVVHLNEYNAIGQLYFNKKIKN